jgi:serine/threonine protein kinase
MPNLIQFGPFELDLATAELRRNRRKVRLPEQQFQILQMLLLRQGGVVSREEIRKKLWPNDTVVEFDRSINVAIMKLRAALGDSAAEPRFIETLSRRGFRFLLPVEGIESKTVEVAPARVLYGPLIGQKVGHYRVLGVLGGGGMGLVYKAEDLKLNRPVALKFPPEELATDPVTLRRFEREARTASQLNHPNICTIYQVAEHGTQPFIVMELLEGENLRDVMLKKSGSVGGENVGLSLKQLLDVATQVAQGLNAAHQKGIIHRDIKPANIFVSPQGQVKIVDFGLAKVGTAFTEVVRAFPEHIRPHSAAPISPEQPGLARDLSLSHFGAAMGTAGYMSPEQVRGEELDCRTDLFSFGLILFEMAVGHRAFSGDTELKVQEAIVNELLPPVRTLNPQLPVRLGEIIWKALQKDRELRYATASEMLEDLQVMEAILDSPTEQGESPPEQEVRRRNNRDIWIAAATAAFVMLAAIGYFVPTRYSLMYFQRYSVHKSADTTSMTHKQISFVGRAYMPAISPDGRSVAYVSAPLGKEQSLILQDLNSTQGLELFHARKIASPTWSPNGSYILVDSSDTNGVPGLFVVSRFGGAPRLVSRHASGVLCWLPGGTQFVTVVAENSIWLVDELDGKDKRIPAPQYDWILSIDCSPKSGRLLFTTMQTTERFQIVSMKTDGTEQRRLIEGDSGISFKSATWSSTEDAIYYFREEKNLSDLMRLPVSGQSAAPTTLVSGLQTGDYLSLTADGSQAVYTRSLSFSNLWSVQLQASKSTPLSAKALTYETLSYDDPIFSPDGRWFAFCVGSPSKTNIYKMAVGGGSRVQLTSNDATASWSPAWSPDGKRIAYISDVGGMSQLWVMDADGGNAIPLENTSTPRSLSWFPSRDILYVRDLRNLYRLNVATQEQKRIFPDSLREGWLRGRPIYSPDGKRIAIFWNHPPEGAWTVSLDTLSTTFLNKDAEPFGWSNEGGFIYAFQGREIFRLNLRDQKWKSVTTMPGEISAATLSPDGQKVIVSVRGANSDVWLMKNFDPHVAATPN